MGFWEFVIVITVIGVVGNVIQSGMKLERQRLRSKTLSGEAEEQRGLIAEMHAEIVKLRDRVNVLEKLATDDDRNLASEIERLRGETRPNY
jgi:hypothetical protein